MAEIRVVVQLSDAEYASLVKDVTAVFEHEKSAKERDRQLRMLLQYRGYMTAGYEESWSLPEAAPAAARKTRQAKKKGRKRRAA